MLSPEGRCKTLDASADGYVRAEACGVLRLALTSPTLDKGITTQDAQAQALVPLALISAATVNQDGRSSSLTAPNGPAQQAVIRAALAQAGARPQALSALQMHGTGGHEAGDVNIAQTTCATCAVVFQLQCLRSLRCGSARLFCLAQLI